MTIVKDILKQVPTLKQPQRKFLETLFVTILASRGRASFRKLSRYCDYSERTISRQYRSEFAWPEFHQRVSNQTLNPDAVLISAQEASLYSQKRQADFWAGLLFQ